MTAKKKHSTSRLVTMEFSPSLLHVCVAQEQPDGDVAFQTRSVPWRTDSAALFSERGAEELADAMRAVAADLRISGATTWISLGGDFCVTRVVSGAEDAVRRELAELESRSALYLSLGHGPKVLAGSIRAIDARQRHALMSVVNRRTLDALLHAGQRAGLKLERIEPALVSLCRLLGQMNADAEKPVVVLHVGKAGAELGISHKGVLLLEYRPAGNDTPEQVATTVTRHMSRLQRYCNRYSRLASGQLEDIYLAGDPEGVANMKRAFQSHGHTAVHELLDPWQVDSRWRPDKTAPTWAMAAPLGLLLLNDQPEKQNEAPNLLERLKATTRKPLTELVRPLVLPLAAAMAVVAIGWLAVWREKSICKSIETEVNRFEGEAMGARLLQATVKRDQQLVKHYEAITAGLQGPDLRALAEQLAQCLPEDTWLDAINVEAQGKLTLSGGSYSEDGVYEFARWLAGVPGLENIALEGMQPAKFPAGNGTHFDVHADIGNISDGEGRNDERG